MEVRSGRGDARRSLADVLKLDLSSSAGSEVASDGALKELHHVGELRIEAEIKSANSDGVDKVSRRGRSKRKQKERH